MSQLAKKIGIAMLGPPLAAGELERPYVGQSEAVILDLCSRGNRLPYLRPHPHLKTYVWSRSFSFAEIAFNLAEIFREDVP